MYGEISRLAEENHSRMVVVTLGVEYPPQDVKKLQFTGGLKNALVVDGETLLFDKIPKNDGKQAIQEAYAREYAHWRGNPPALIDPHHNAKAHKIIAHEITRVIRNDLDNGGHPVPENR